MDSIKGESMSKKEENELARLRRQLAETTKALEDAECRAIAWESMVEAIEQDLGIPIEEKHRKNAREAAKRKLK